jgi:hypothetical protein
MHERALQDYTTRSALGRLLDVLGHLMRPGRKDGEILERTHLCLQL